MTLWAVTFVSVIVAICGAYWAFVERPERREDVLLRTRLGTGASKVLAIQRHLLKEVTPLSAVGPLRGLMKRASKLIGPTQRLVDESGVRMTVGRLVLMSGCLMLFTLLLVTALTAQLWLGLVVGAGAGLLPYVYLSWARTKRTRKFEEHFPEAIDLISRAMRAGHTFLAGLLMAADEIPDPVGTEFRTIYNEQNFGVPLPTAMRSFAQRVPVLDARFFVTAVLTQREAGGNLAEILDNLAAVIRERFKVKRHVRVVSAHGRMTGWVLCGLPPALALAFFIITPQHMQTMITDPLGVRMLIAAVIMQIVGSLIIRKIVNIEY